MWSTAEKLWRNYDRTVITLWRIIAVLLWRNYAQLRRRMRIRSHCADLIRISPPLFSLSISHSFSNYFLPTGKNLIKNCTNMRSEWCPFPYPNFSKFNASWVWSVLPPDSPGSSRRTLKPDHTRLALTILVFVAHVLDYCNLKQRKDHSNHRLHSQSQLTIFLAVLIFVFVDQPKQENRNEDMMIISLTIEMILPSWWTWRSSSIHLNRKKETTMIVRVPIEIVLSSSWRSRWSSLSFN